MSSGMGSVWICVGLGWSLGGSGVGSSSNTWSGIGTLTKVGSTSSGVSLSITVFGI